MNENTTNKYVYKIMNAVQADLVKNGIAKDQKNTQQGYKFRGIDDVFNEVGPLLAHHKLLILPRMTSWQCTEHTNAKGTVMFHVKVDAEFDFVAAEDGSCHMVRMVGEAMDSSDKATNKAMSAAYKYAVIQSFSIPIEGENDADFDSPEAGGDQGKQEMVMTNRLVPKHYWDATDQIAKDKIIGAGNSIRKNDDDKKWYIVEPKKHGSSPLGRLSDDAKIAGMIPTKEPELPATPAAAEGEIHWNGRVEQVTEKSTANGANYWEIETDVGECFCKNKQLVEELKIMGSEAMRFHVQPSTRRRGAYELIDFEGGLA